MNKKILFSLTGAVVLAFSASSTLSAAELLLNGNFESPTVSAGDHVGTAATSWTAAFQAINLNNPNNLVNGPVTGNNATSPLGIYPGDSANGHAQSFDGNGGDIYLTETITPNVTGPVSVSIAFGGRDSGSATGTGSFWQILTAGGAVLGNGPTINPATSSWMASTVSATAFSLTAGTNYTFRISLANADMVDAASVQTVPEPSTLAAAGIGAGLLGWMGFKRRRA